jgi:signal transduction histidine kinase/CheY-like chemotaxis protein
VRLRSHLIVLVLAAVAPLLAFAVFIVVQDLKQQREILDRGMRDTVRALSSAIDGEVNTSLALLETLAAAAALDGGDLKTFHQICVRAMQARKRAYVTLFDVSGKPRVNSSRPFGAALPNPLRGTRPPGADSRYPEVPLGGGNPVKQVLETGRPVVSDLFISLVTAGPRIGLDIPVVRQGRVRYVLEMSIDAEEFARLLVEQRPPADSLLALVDRKGLVIARNVDSARRVGTPLGASLAAHAAEPEGGSRVGRTAEGVDVYHVFARSRLTGWTTSLSMPKSDALASLTEALALLAGGAAIAVLLGLLAALVIGKRISVPISSLAVSADSLARGERAQLDVSAVRELEELHRALVTAGMEVREGVAERERRRLAEAKEAEAHAAARAKDEFLAVLSHELRNPLAALSSAAHVLKMADPASETAVKARRVVERQTKHMSRLVGDLLDVSRITVGKLALDRERFDLGEMVARLASVWRASGRFERHAVAVETAPVWVDADRARVEQIVANLLDNALKFTPAGKAVKLSVKEEDGGAVLRVADQGRGISAEAAGRIFDLFVQEGQDGEGGLGIGLALVKRLAEMHGGSVSVAGADGGGSVFTVRLPSAPQPAVQEPAGASRPRGARSVLIVEDNDDARQMLAEELALDGHEVRVARDGASGLALAGEAQPDIALIDIGLPDMDGYEVARRLRAAHNGQRIGLVALTGFGQPEDQRRALDAGFDAHIVKPVTAERLKQVLAELR